MAAALPLSFSRLDAFWTASSFAEISLWSDMLAKRPSPLDPVNEWDGWYDEGWIEDAGRSGELGRPL